MQIKIESVEQLENAASIFVNKVFDENFKKKTEKCIAFYGDMGAGKTTFIKSLCKVLGVDDTVNSPTFAIINEYHNVDNEVIFHFDFYRINNISEALDLGCEDYFYSGNLCLIEWPEKIESLLPESIVRVNIEEIDNNTRVLSLKN